MPEPYEKTEEIRVLKVLIVGSGPSGLAAAGVLAKRGHKIEVWDKNEKFGGALRLIPDERLDKSRIDEIVEELTDQGVVFKSNVVFDFSNLDSYLLQFEKIIFATGTQKAKKLGVEGENLPNVLMSLDYLKKPVSADNVIVIGGGDVAVDCAFVSSMNSQSVTLCYRRKEENMRACKSEINNAKKNGVKFAFELVPKKITNDGVLFDKNGKDVFICADLIIVAIGQTSNLPKEIENIPNVVLIGDAATGASSIIQAVAHAKQIAYQI